MKDPAVLFYTSDFLTGTSLMPDEQIGRYIKLLCLHHQKGRLTRDQFFCIARESDSELIEKFSVDEVGKYFNERMEIESEKRRKYSESRRNNRKGSPTYEKDMKKICKTYEKHMSPHMENENEDVNIDENKKVKEKKHKYGEYGHVLLTDLQHYRLLDEWGKLELDEMIRLLDEGIQLKGYKYSDHNLAIRKWHKKEFTKQTPKPQTRHLSEGRVCSKCSRSLLDHETEENCPRCEELRNDVD